MKYGLAFDLEYCTGCQTCCVACRQENGYSEYDWGVKITEQIYKRPDGRIQVDYLPYPTKLCNLCAERLASGFDSKPSCVKHCPSACIEYGELPALFAKAENMQRPVVYAIL